MKDARFAIFFYLLVSIVCSPILKGYRRDTRYSSLQCKESIDRRKISLCRVSSLKLGKCYPPASVNKSVNNVKTKKEQNLNPTALFDLSQNVVDKSSMLLPFLKTYENLSLAQNDDKNLSKNAVKKSSSIQPILRLNLKDSSAHEKQSETIKKDIFNQKIVENRLYKRKPSNLIEAQKKVHFKIDHYFYSFLKKHKEIANKLPMVNRFQCEASCRFRLTLKTHILFKKCSQSVTDQKLKTNTYLSYDNLDLPLKKRKVIREKFNHDHLGSCKLQDSIFNNDIVNKIEIYFLHSCIRLNNINYYTKYLIKLNTTVHNFTENQSIDNLKNTFFHNFFNSEMKEVIQNISKIIDSNYSKMNQNLYLITYLFIKIPEIENLLHLVQELYELHFISGDDIIRPFLSKNLEFEITEIEICTQDCISLFNLDNEDTMITQLSRTEQHRDNLETKEIYYKDKKHDLKFKKNFDMMCDEDKIETQSLERGIIEISSLTSDECCYMNPEDANLTEKANNKMIIKNSVKNLESQKKEFDDLMIRMKNIICKTNQNRKTDLNQNLFLEMPELIFYISWRHKNYILDETENLRGDEKKLINEVLNFFEIDYEEQEDIKLQKTIYTLRIYIYNSLNDSKQKVYPQKYFYNVALKSIKLDYGSEKCVKSDVGFLFLLLSFTLESMECSEYFKFFLQSGEFYTKKPHAYFVGNLLRNKILSFEIVFALNCIFDFLKKIHSQSQIRNLGTSILYPFHDKILVFSTCRLCNNCFVTYSGTFYVVKHFCNEIITIINST